MALLKDLIHMTIVHHLTFKILNLNKISLISKWNEYGLNTKMNKLDNGRLIKNNINLKIIITLCF